MFINSEFNEEFYTYALQGFKNHKEMWTGEKIIVHAKPITISIVLVDLLKLSLGEDTVNDN